MKPSRCYFAGVRGEGDKLIVRVSMHTNPPGNLCDAIVGFLRELTGEDVRLFEFKYCPVCKGSSPIKIVREIESEATKIPARPDPNLN